MGRATEDEEGQREGGQAGEEEERHVGPVGAAELTIFTPPPPNPPFVTGQLDNLREPLGALQHIIQWFIGLLTSHGMERILHTKNLFCNTGPVRTFANGERNRSLFTIL